MWSFLFSNRIKIRSTRKAEAEREKFGKDIRFYTALIESGKPARLKQLKTMVESAEYKAKRKAFRAFTWKSRTPEEKWANSDEHKLFMEYKQLKNDPELSRFCDLAGDPVFKRYRQWCMTFEDTFSGMSLNTGKWIVRYYAGERLLKDTYGVGQDIQLFQPQNVSVSENNLNLVFKKEQTEGKYWDARLGVIAKKYAYTSGMVNTALSFRQCLGRFEAKIKINNSEVDQCFWLAGDGLLPHVNIVNFSKAGYRAGCFTKRQMEGCDDTELRKQVKLKPGYYIFTLEWTPDKLIWKINDCTVRETENRLPQLPLFVGLSLGATREIAETPQSMQVEWVRVYTKNNAD